MNAGSGSDSAEDPNKDALDVLIDQNQRFFAIYDSRRGSAETKAAGILTADVAIAGLTATAVGLTKHVNSLLLVGLGVLLLLLVVSVIFAIYTGAAAGLRRRRHGPAKMFDAIDIYVTRRAAAQQASSDQQSRDAANTREGAGVDPRLSEPPMNDPERLKAGADTPLLSTESPKYRQAAEALDAEALNLEKACDPTDPAIIIRLRTLNVWQRRREDAHELAQRKDQGAGAAGIALGFALLWGAVLFGLIIGSHV
jgi:hypothetical protein